MNVLLRTLPQIGLWPALLLLDARAAAVVALAAIALLALVILLPSKEPWRRLCGLIREAGRASRPPPSDRAPRT